MRNESEAISDDEFVDCMKYTHDVISSLLLIGLATEDRTYIETALEILTGRSAKKLVERFRALG